MRGVVSAGIIGVAVVIAAIMGSQDAQAWLIGLAVSVTSLLLAAVARLSRRS
jgi:chromate transport protein ChrA